MVAGPVAVEHESIGRIRRPRPLQEEFLMRLRSIKRRLSALAVAICTAVILSLPAAASARPIYDRDVVVTQVESGGGSSLALPLAGVALVVVLTGAGYVAFRATR